MRFPINIFFVALSGCNIHAGVGIHNNSIDSENFGESEWLGVVRADHSLSDRFEIYGEHISVPGNDSGYGLNHIGVMVKLK